MSLSSQTLCHAAYSHKTELLFSADDEAPCLGLCRQLTKACTQHIWSCCTVTIVQLCELRTGVFYWARAPFPVCDRQGFLECLLLCVKDQAAANETHAS